MCAFMSQIVGVGWWLLHPKPVDGRGRVDGFPYYIIPTIMACEKPEKKKRKEKTFNQQIQVSWPLAPRNHVIISWKFSYCVRMCYLVIWRLVLDHTQYVLKIINLQNLGIWCLGTKTLNSPKPLRSISSVLWRPLQHIKLNYTFKE